MLLDLIRSRPHMAYAPSGEPSGPSSDLDWGGATILPAREFSSCVAATYEILHRLIAATPHLAARMSFAAMKQLMRRTYITRPETGWENGVAGGLVDAGLADFVPIEESRAGDFAQVQWSPSSNPWSGHSVVLLSAPMPSPKGTGALVVWDYSANIGRPAFLPPADVFPEPRPAWMLERRAGIQVDYHALVKGDRTWHVARLK